jgi:hypothetical protein
MNEQPFRIVVSTATSAFRRSPDKALHLISKPMIYQKGRPLPSPEGVPDEPFIIVDIQEFAEVEPTEPTDPTPENPEGDPGEPGEDAFFLIYAVGADGSQPAADDIGVLTKIPADLIIRKDSRVSANEMLMALRQMQAEGEKAVQRVPPPQPPVAPTFQAATAQPAPVAQPPVQGAVAAPVAQPPVQPTVQAPMAPAQVQPPVQAEVVDPPQPAPPATIAVAMPPEVAAMAPPPFAPPIAVVAPSEETSDASDDGQ